MSNFDLTTAPIGFFPTPLLKLEHLSALLAGPDIYVKRDDLTGLALGGNKTRKLRFILGDALAKEADTVITAGAIQSNHCRQTAAAAAMLQLECHLVLGGSKPQECKGNLLLAQLFGSHIHWAADHRKGEDIPELVKQLKSQGKKTYVVPSGGSNTLGAAAFAQAIHELKTQQEQDFSHIVFASSSGGTHAGMIVGKQQSGISSEIIGINIDKQGMGELTLAAYIEQLCNDTGKLLGVDHQFTAQDVNLNDDYFGEGYGVVADLEREAIKLMAQKEGILLDPIYTGRAMGGLIDMIKKGRFTADDRVLFWHTGGAPALFAYNEVI